MSKALRNKTRLNAAAVSVTEYGARGDGVTDDTAAIQAAINVANKVYLPSGTYVVSSTLSFAATQSMLFGDGYKTQIAFTGSTVCIDFNGYAGCEVSDLVIYATGGTTGIRIGPNAGLTRYPHWWRLSRVIAIGNTPNWSSTSLASSRSGFSTAAIRVITAFYGEAEQCEASYTTGAGFLLESQANGNTFTACHARECAIGVNIKGGAASNGNCWFGGNIEASITGSVGIQLEDTDRNIFSCRMEVSAASGTHVRVVPTSLAQENQFLGMCLTGTSAGYVLGDGVGSNQVRGTFINGGKLGTSVAINSDCSDTVLACSPSGASGITLTDNGYGSIVNLDFSGGKWYERPSNQNTAAFNHDYLVGTGSVRESMGDNARTMSFTSATDLFTWEKVSASGTNLPVMRFGAYRVWVNPLDGKMYIKGGTPTTPTDGTVIGTQT